MRRFLTWIAAGVALVVLASPGRGGLGAQSLADVARAEEARRKIAPKATKTYTNQDLRPDTRSQRPSEPLPSTPAGMSPAPATAPTADAETKEAEPDPRKDEQYWRRRISEARERLERTKLFAEALQSRINALTTDFVNRDDYAQRAVIGQDRQKALDELTRVQNEVRDSTKAIADIEEEARRAGVPPGWLR